MTTQQIHYFLEVAKQLSFTKAAQCLFVSQSTLSKQIASMENELGMQLFLRYRHSVSLTPAGLLLRAELGKIESSLALALDHAQRMGKGTEGHLVVAILDILDPQLVVFPALERFRKKYPNVDIELMSCGFSEMRRLLGNRGADVAFDKLFQLRLIPDFEVMPVYAVTPSFMFPANHPLATRDKVKIADLINDSFIVLQPDECAVHMESLIELCIRGGYYPRIAKYASSNTAKIFYVSQGYGIALFDQELPLPPWANVKLVPMEDMLPRSQMKFNRDPDIHVGWFHDTTNPAVQLFIDTVTELLSENLTKQTIENSNEVIS